MERSPDVVLVFLLVLLVLETTAKTENENDDEKDLGIRVSEVFLMRFALDPPGPIPAADKGASLRIAQPSHTAARMGQIILSQTQWRSAEPRPAWHAPSNRFDIAAHNLHPDQAMSDDFQQLLSATIHHLEDLKAHGQRFVAVSPETLRMLSQPGSAPTRQSARTTTPRPSAAAPARPVTAPTSPPARAAAPEPVAPRPADPAKDKALAELRERALVCTRCPNLVRFRKQVVFGVGNPNAELMFVGEAPGADEDAQGEPFVGRAGQLLTKIIETMGLSRDTVYIGNILKCRPDVPAGAPGNRKPTPEEMETCIPWLLDQIEIIQPKVMVALGATAVEGLIGGTVKITHMRGQWKAFNGIPLMPTFHPSYLLRGNDIRKKRQVWEDMLQVMEKLEMPISEKQRGFFLKK